MGEAAKADHNLELLWSPHMAEVATQVEKQLTDEGQIAFRQELYDAALEFLAVGSTRALNDVLQSWYRTMLFKLNGVDDVWDDEPGQPMTIGEVRDYMGV